MAVEPRRGCGYRKVGGLYLVSGGESMGCGRLPMPLTVCPVCSHGIKQTRGWTWVDAAHILGAEPCHATEGYLNVECDGCRWCPLAAERLKSFGRAGLLWVGERFYPTTAAFNDEAVKLGISRRIATVPRDFKLGETWVLFAHPKAALCGDCDGEAGDNVVLPMCKGCDGRGRVPGIFRMFKPTRIEKIVLESQRDTEEVADLIARGITPVYVPDDDKDHRGSVYERRALDESPTPK